ncbi:hypothetical protein ACE6H2_024777 [Prunus campanulata]
MAVMVARALWKLDQGNSAIFCSLQESTTLYSFCSAPGEGFRRCIALMEITEVVEKDAELRRCAFNPSSPAWKCVIPKPKEGLGSGISVLNPVQIRSGMDKAGQARNGQMKRFLALFAEPRGSTRRWAV